MALTSLVVCADAKAVQVLSRILREMGIRPEHCGDPREAAVLLRAKRYDVLLADCADEASGLDLIAACKANAAAQDTLIVAIVDTANNIREVFAKGANFALYRPVEPERAANSLRAARTLLPDERRRKPRVPARGAVSLAFAAAENVPGNLVDLSADGLAIQAERTLPRGCQVYFEFKLPEHGSTIRLSGEVVWQDFMGRVGLNFSRVPQSSRQLLDAWLRENLFRQLEAGSLPAIAQQSGDASDAGGERRVQSRFSCRLGAEVYAAGSKVPLRCGLIDVGPGGCYVESTQVFPANTPVDIVVRTLDLKLRLKGRVRSSHVGYGMGVQFDLSTRQEREEVKRLLDSQAQNSVDSEVSIEIE
ncbi:MAG TPA: PilZ domain-containing protein [Terriglobales bacterium]